LDILQLLIGGIANGCIYGLVALGFVLIYKATEAVNFAQGDMMMIGAFITLTMVNEEWWGLPFGIGVILAIVIMAGLSYLLEVVVIRKLFGQPQFAVVILTIALGFVLRFLAGVIWGHDPQSLETPFAGKAFDIGGLILGYDEAVVIIATAVLTISLYFFFQRTRLGVAMQAASQKRMLRLLQCCLRQAQLQILCDSWKSPCFLCGSGPRGSVCRSRHDFGMRNDRSVDRLLNRLA